MQHILYGNNISLQIYMYMQFFLAHLFHVQYTQFKCAGAKNRKQRNQTTKTSEITKMKPLTIQNQTHQDEQNSK